MDSCKSVISNSCFFMLTYAEDVSENSESFVCSVEEASGKGTLYNNGTFNDQ